MSRSGPESSNRGERITGVAYSARPPAALHMAVFDALPKTVRRAIASAPFDLDTIAIADLVKRGFPPEAIVKEIARVSHAIADLAVTQRTGKLR